MVTWFDIDRERLGPDGRISYSDCGGLGGAMLPRDGAFMVSRAFLGHARCQDGGFWNGHHGRRAGVTGAGSLFLRWSLVRPPRNCDSALIAPTRIVISQVSVLFRKLSLGISLVNDASPSESGIPSHPGRGTQKPFHLVMRFQA